MGINLYNIKKTNKTLLLYIIILSVFISGLVGAKRLSKKSLNYTYSFGLVGDEPIASRRGKTMLYGASMNKPILAFINLYLAENVGGVEALSKDLLMGLLVYKKFYFSQNKHNGRWALKPWRRGKCVISSNEINRALSGKTTTPAGKNKCAEAFYKIYGPRIGIGAQEAASVINKDLKLRGYIGGVRWGSGRNPDTGDWESQNQQSAIGYHKFLSFLIKHSKRPDSKYHVAAATVLKYMKMRHGGFGVWYSGGAHDRNFAKWLNNRLQEKGHTFKIKTVFGKGGLWKGALHYSIVINDQYILTIYSKQLDGARMSTKEQRLIMREIALEVLSNNISRIEAGALPKGIGDLPLADLNVLHFDVDTQDTCKQVEVTPPENFDFEQFYNELNKYFKDYGGAAGILKSCGLTKVFNEEHVLAYDMLQRKKIRDVQERARSEAGLSKRLFEKWYQHIKKPKTVSGKKNIINYIKQNPEQEINLDNPRGTKKGFGGDKEVKLPFDYGEWPHLINPADDMGWDLVIVPSSSKKSKNLIPVGFVEYKDQAVRKKGNDKIIIASNGEYAKKDKAIIDDFFKNIDKFKEVTWLTGLKLET